MMTPEEKKNTRSDKWIRIGLALGVAVGVIIGASVGVSNEIIIGVSIGVVAGFLIIGVLQQQARDD